MSLVSGRRRDKINHWIMKLGSIIPADGTSTEIGSSGRLSIAAIDGQSKGGILSKACEYVQMLQEKQSAWYGHCKSFGLFIFLNNSLHISALKMHRCRKTVAQHLKRKSTKTKLLDFVVKMNY